MRVLFFILKLNNIAGGAERVLCELSNRLIKRGFQVTIVSFDNLTTEPFYKFNNKIIFKNFGFELKNNKLNLFSLIKKIPNLRQYIIEVNPSIAIGFMHTGFVPLTFSLIGSKIPVIGSEHIIKRHYDKKLLEFLTVIISSFFISLITVVSKSSKDGFPHVLRKKMKVVPNFISKPKSTTRTNNYKKKNIILSIGRLDEQKDQKTLISAFALISELYPSWSIKIIGEGKLKKQLESHAQNLGICAKVKFQRNTIDISSEYQRASIFVLPSIYESLGLVLLEAMYFKLPIIAFYDCEGANELVLDNENGILVTPAASREKALATAMEKLIKNPKKRELFGNNGHKYFLKNVDNNSTFFKWMDIISQFSK